MLSSLVGSFLMIVTCVTFSTSQCAEGTRFACASCSTVSICSYGGGQVDAYRCNTMDSGRPFCSGNTGTCKSAPEGNCIQPSELCPHALDSFPEPSSCSQYIQCDTLKRAQTVNCSPSIYVYNHTSKSCGPRQTSADCFQINCALAGNQNRWTSYRPAPKLAFYCSSVVGAMTFECSGENQVFNVASRSCVFGCPSEGRFPVPDDTAKYYQCTRGVYNVLVAREVAYSAGLVFDPSSNNCVTQSTTTVGLSSSTTTQVSTTSSSSEATTLAVTSTSSTSTTTTETSQ